MPDTYPLTYDVDYPDRKLDRLTSAFRIFTAIPIMIVLAAIGGLTEVSTSGGHTTTVAASGSALLTLPPLLMIVFRRKYPRWWYDFNVELLRFHNRVGVYVALMDDRYPSTDERQSVHLEVAYPDATRLNRLLPLVKWLLAFPHYFVLAFLYIGAFFAVVIAWFAVLFTGKMPQGLFNAMRSALAYLSRSTGYFLLLTEDYPPFSYEQAGAAPAGEISSEAASRQS